ncbi:MAG: hypothetical protein JJU37_00340 [Balneolaceae bacterium]|nr:hypothetical protein [Balneolaceae bacterium]
MKTNKFLLILVSIMFALSACSDDSVSIIDPDPDPDPDPTEELDPALVGTWVLDPTAGSLAVGPTATDLSWWSISSGDVENRACLYEDQYVFGDDGSFQNVLGEETWLEEWQGVDAEGCGAPVAPHDGSTVGDWSTLNNSVTIEGEGVFLGLPKVHNGGEDGNPANNRITYTYELSDNDETLEIRIDGWNPDVDEATWYFRFIKQ